MTLVELRAGEKRPAFVVFAAMVLVVAGHTSLETVRDALFLTKLGPGRLAVVMGLIALLSLGAARANTRLVRALGRRDALVFTLVGAAWGSGIFACIPLTALTIFILYVFSALLGTLLLAQLWTCAGDNFTVAQGRRLFPFIGAGAVTGSIFGAFGTAIWLEHGGFRPLLVAGACLFLATALLATALPRRVSQAQDAGVTPASPVHARAAASDDSAYILRVGALVGIATAAVLVADYLFKTRVAATVPPAALGGFLARYYGVCNVIALVVQVLIARPLLRRLGTAGALLVMPLSLLAGAGGIVFSSGALAAVLLAKGIDGSMRHSLQRLLTELIVLPLSPDARARSKPLFEGVFGRGVQAAASLGLLILSTFGLTSPSILGGVLAALSATWVVIALALRKPYLDLFRHALARGTLEHDSDVAFDRKAIEAVQQALSSRDETQAIAAMGLLRDHGAVGLIPGLILFHESPVVLERALVILGSSAREDWYPQAERLLAHPHASVRLGAVRALGPTRSAEIGKMSSDADPRVRALAAFALVKGGAPEQDARVAAILAERGAHGHAARVALLSAIAGDGDRRWGSVLARIIGDAPHAPLPHEAAAIARCAELRFLPRLVESLAVPSVRDASRRALLSFGGAALDVLAQALDDVALPAKVRREIPLAIARFRVQRSCDLLGERLASEPSGAVRFRILRGLNQLASEPELRLGAELIERELRRNLLEHARIAVLLGALHGDERARQGYGALLFALLEDKSLQAVERVFRLLQLAHRGEDVRSLYYAIRSTDLGARANAFEFLDALSAASGWAAELRALLALATDDLTFGERGARAVSLAPGLPHDYAEIIDVLASDDDAAVSELATRHQSELPNRRGRPGLPAQASTATP